MTTETASADHNKLAMIGCGLIAQAHGIAAARSENDVSFTACSSKSVASARAFADQFGVAKVYEEHATLLANEELHGVVIASPPDSHEQIINDCLAAGVKFILCEKPLTANAAEAVSIKAGAESAGATILEGFMYRHHPQITELLKQAHNANLGPIDQLQCSVNMLDASELDGKPLPGNWRRDARVGGVMHDFLCYPIDIANLLMQAEPCKAFARVFESPTYGTPYRVFAMVEYENGALASFSASRRSDFSQPLFVAGERGSIRLATAFNPIGDTRLVVHSSEGLIGQRRQVVEVPVAEPISERLIDLQVFTTQLDHFVDLMRGKAEAIVSLEQSVRNARVRDALIESGVSDCWCAIS